jgi:hypothetical protein
MHQGLQARQPHSLLSLRKRLLMVVLALVLQLV